MLEVTEVFERDRAAEAELVYGTSDPGHPGWPELGAPQPGRGRPRPGRGRPPGRAGGRAGLTPAETRAAFASQGWSTVVGTRPATRSTGRTST